MDERRSSAGLGQNEIPRGRGRCGVSELSLFGREVDNGAEMGDELPRCAGRGFVRLRTLLQGAEWTLEQADPLADRIVPVEVPRRFADRQAGIDEFPGMISVEEQLLGDEGHELIGLERNKNAGANRSLVEKAADRRADDEPTGSRGFHCRQAEPFAKRRHKQGIARQWYRPAGANCGPAASVAC